MLRFRSIATIAACLLLAVTTAHADEKEEAQRHFQAGVSLQKVEDFESAIAAFESSLRLYPTKSALFNLANCLRAVHRYAEALDALERLKRDYSAELEDPMRTAVDRQLEELRNLTASLVVRVDQQGAQVSVDGKIVGSAPLSEPLRLSPGAHDIEVTLKGFAPEKLTVSLVSRQQITKEVKLKKLSPPPAPPRAKPQPPHPSPTEPTPVTAPNERGTTALVSVGWITTGTGAALLAGAAVTGSWALSLDAELARACSDGHCPESRGSDIDRLDTLAGLTNVTLGAGLVLTAAGVTMLVLDGGSRRPATEDATVQVTLSPRFVGARLGQRF
jgi:hypothetical protein